MLRKKKIILLLMVLYVSCFTNVFAQDQKPLYFIGDDDFPPYSFMIDEQLEGIDCAIIKELGKRLQRDIKVKLYPWKDLLTAVKQGECDGAFSLFRTAEREQFSLYALSVPIHYSELAVFVKKGKSFKFETISDLFGKRVGKNYGFSIEDEFDKALLDKRIMVEEVEGVQKNIKLVLDNKIDCFVDNYQVTLYVLKQMHLLDKLEVLPKRLRKRRKAYLVLSKQSPLADKEQLLMKINQTLIGMEADGTIQKINDEWVKLLRQKNS